MIVCGSFSMVSFRLVIYIYNIIVKLDRYILNITYNLVNLRWCVQCRIILFYVSGK